MQNLSAARWAGLAADNMIKVERALLSVADKAGVVELGQCLTQIGVQVISTGGTATVLSEAGVACQNIATITGQEQALDGRLKTLQQAVLGGILYDRDAVGQQAELEQLGAQPIDLVAVNFYPFAQGAAQGKDRAELVELIDIGGPTMVRSAAKNHRHVVVIVDRNDYAAVIQQLHANDGCVTRELAARLAAKVFALTASYDAGIAATLAGNSCAPVIPQLVSSLLNLTELSYGENPHQAGWVGHAAEQLHQLGGAQLSYNNLQDALAAWRCVASFAQPCCAIIKHTNPCGVAVGKTLLEAHARALAADEVSAYGGVVACNGEINDELLRAIREVFCEVLIAPSFSPAAAATLGKAKRLKALQAPIGEGSVDARVAGGLALVQQRDADSLTATDCAQVTTTAPTAPQLEDLLFAWRVAMHTRSNAIVLAREGKTIGIGAGQTSRVEAAQLAVERARAKGFDPTGAVAASDAFFPFADGVEYLTNAGVAAIIHPGGSKRDPEVTAAADSAGIAMLTTGVRHFIH